MYFLEFIRILKGRDGTAGVSFRPDLCREGAWREAVGKQ